MAYEIRLHPVAEVEIWEAVDWYDEQQPDLGKAFARELEVMVTAIRSSPFQFPEVAIHKRKAVLQRFPYMVIFEVDPEVIYILAVFHTSRDPAEWKER